MLKSLEGVCLDGRIELLEPAPPDARGPVIVTFLASSSDSGDDADESTPLRRENGLLVYDGRLIGSAEATLEAVREDRIRQFLPETLP